jgi:hypothetical protein
VYPEGIGWTPPVAALGPTAASTIGNFYKPISRLLQDGWLAAKELIKGTIDGSDDNPRLIVAWMKSDKLAVDHLSNCASHLSQPVIRDSAARIGERLKFFGPLACCPNIA